MRRVIGLFLLCPLWVAGQYVDTVKGRLTVKYNNPHRIKLAVLAGSAFETQSCEGGIMLPTGFVDVHFRPSKWTVFHGAFTQQFQVGWQYQKIKDTRNLEFGGRVFFSQKIVDKTKTFTAGTKAWNYDFFFPVKVLWNLGLSGSFRYGTAVFNTGLDPNTAIRFRNLENQKIVFLERAAIPYQFTELSGGFVVSTSSSMKVTAHIPNSSQKRGRRMKTYTEFRMEAILGKTFNYDTTISRKFNDQAVKYTDYAVRIDRMESWGFKMQGIFRRKLMGFKIETGIKPGVYYRFSRNERGSILDRTYLQFGFGFGWM